MNIPFYPKHKSLGPKEIASTIDPGCHQYLEQSYLGLLMLVDFSLIPEEIQRDLIEYDLVQPSNVDNQDVVTLTPVGRLVLTYNKER